jgi:membrane associated rhomboid family serine protease
MTLTIIGVSTLFFMLELWGGEAFIQRWAFVPAELMTPHGFITIFTSMFLHAGWVHFLGNMLFFWAFAPQIEDVMGPVSFLIFFCWGCRGGSHTSVGRPHLNALQPRSQWRDRVRHGRIPGHVSKR